MERNTCPTCNAPLTDAKGDCPACDCAAAARPRRNILLRILALAVAVILGSWIYILNSNTRSTEPPITTFADDDKEMNAAMEEARKTLDPFIAQLERPKTTQSYFSIKARFTVSEGKAEHIWLDDIQYDGTSFTGRIGNRPTDVRTLELGASCVITRDQVSDWMIIEDGCLVGGRTIRVARNRKSESEREEFDRKVRFRFE